MIGEWYKLWDGIPPFPLYLLGTLLDEWAKRGGWHSKNGYSLLPFCCSLPCFKIQFCQGLLDTHWFKIIVAKPRFLQLARTSHETISLPRPKVLETWSQLLKRWRALSTGQISSYWTAQQVSLIFIHWIVVYPAESTIQLLNNWGRSVVKIRLCDVSDLYSSS